MFFGLDGTAGSKPPQDGAFLLAPDGSQVLQMKKNLAITMTAVLAALLVGLSRTARAVPTFQAYIEGATAGSMGPDEDSWFTTESSFNLIVVGAYGPTTVAPLTEVTLALSVPEGETGTISITGADGAVLLTTRQEVGSTGYYNPNADADEALLADVAGNTGYDTKNFLPESQQLNNNHYPFQDDVSDFLIYSIGDFYNIGDVHNYNAGDGTITLEGQGQEKTFSVEIGGFTRVHFDVYGFETTEQGQEFRSTWDINPASHDCTYVPVPAAVFLTGLGVGFVAWLRRKKLLTDRTGKP